ncbi:MAG: hypothetical protein H7259_05400, partial [Cytophagales bacterium]|nr:hypothetical protein [Cytophaga sp.]
MLKFLKEFDPFRLLFIALIAIATRFYWLTEDVYLIPALRWLSIGEMMSGGNTLYKDIWTTLEPFSAGTYYFIGLIFGKSIIVLRILSLLLCLMQAFMFNYFVEKTNIYDQKTSYPAFFYVLFASINYDFFTLSPVQLGLTFLLPVMYILFKDVRVGEKPNNHFIAGFFLGIASLFYLPFACFILFTVYSFVVFSSFDVKRVFQLLFAFAFPWAMVFTYYYLNGALYEVFENLIGGNFMAERILYADPIQIIKVALPSIIVAGISFLLVSSKRNFLNFQYSCMKIMALWFVNGLLSFVLMDEWSYFNIYILVPVFTFFTVYLFLQIERTAIKESLFWSITIVFVLLHLHNVRVDKMRASKDGSSMLISKDSEVRFNGTAIQDKTVLLMGFYPEALIHNKQATIYADWHLALRHFNDLNNYEHISEIYTNVYEHQPEFIIDKAGIMPHLMERIPGLKSSYEISYDKKVFKRR